jgi:hypothetical protein
MQIMEIYAMNIPSIVAFTPVEATIASSLLFRALSSTDRGMGTRVPFRIPSG